MARWRKGIEAAEPDEKETCQPMLDLLQRSLGKSASEPGVLPSWTVRLQAWVASMFWGYAQKTVAREMFLQRNRSKWGERKVFSTP